MEDVLSCSEAAEPVCENPPEALGEQVSSMMCDSGSQVWQSESQRVLESAGSTLPDLTLFDDNGCFDASPMTADFDGGVSEPTDGGVPEPTDGGLPPGGVGDTPPPSVDGGSAPVDAGTPPTDTTGGECGEGAGAHPATDTLRSGDVETIFERNFDRLDADSDGFVSSSEIDSAMENPCHQGEDAQMLQLLKQHQGDLEELSNDETGDENDGVTRADIQQLTELAGRDAADRDADQNSFIGRIDVALHSSGTILERTNHDLYATDDPLPSITPESVLQGHVGDCYFMSAVASLAQRNPEAIRDMIQDNHDGTYTVTFPADPENPVTIDAPTDAELAQYAEGGANGTWPAVLEKAYGAYEGGTTVPADALDGGSVTDAGVRLLSPGGGDSDQMSCTSREEIDRKLTEAIANGRPITAHTDNELFSLIGLADNRTDGLELQGGHDYSVMGYDPEAGTVTLRNPWGSGEPLGDDGQPRDGVNDGVFTMTMDEFEQEFDRVAYGQ